MFNKKCLFRNWSKGDGVDGVVGDNINIGSNVNINKNIDNNTNSNNNDNNDNDDDDNEDDIINNGEDDNDSDDNDSEDDNTNINNNVDDNKYNHIYESKYDNKYNNNDNGNDDDDGNDESEYVPVYGIISPNKYRPKRRRKILWAIIQFHQLLPFLPLPTLPLPTLTVTTKNHPILLLFLLPIVLLLRLLSTPHRVAFLKSKVAKNKLYFKLQTPNSKLKYSDNPQKKETTPNITTTSQPNTHTPPFIIRYI